MLTRAFIVPIEQLGVVIEWMETRCAPDQASTIDVQSRVIAIECPSTLVANQIATRVGDRSGWHRDQDLWLFLEVLEPGVDIEAEFEFAHEVVSGIGLFDECEVAECRVLEVGFRSADQKRNFHAAADAGTFSS